MPQGKPQGKPECKKNCDSNPEPDPSEHFDGAVPIGVSTGHPAITAGTIGARVTDETDVFALSNNHVYAATNFLDCDGTDSDDYDCAIGDPVIQPGAFDDGLSPRDDIGELFAFEPIVFGACTNDPAGPTNVMDAAIALSSTADLGNTTPSAGYGTPKSTTVAAALNMKVKKFGRTTGQTKGTVFAFNATVNVSYGPGQVACFRNQIIISPGTFSAPGDSGSLVVGDGKGRARSDDGKPIGLLFAGSPSYTIISPIGAILTRFGVTIDGN